MGLIWGDTRSIDYSSNEELFGAIYPKQGY